MKTLIRDSLKETLHLFLWSLVLWLIWQKWSLYRGWPQLSFIDFLCGSLMLAIAAEIWHKSEPHIEPANQEMYHVCHFCGKSETCKLGKKATKKGLSVMDRPEWEEPHNDVPQI